METLKIGEPVFLKGGSPQMTITRIEGETAHCTRYVGSTRYEESHPLAALVPASQYLAARGPRIVRTT